MTKRNLTYQEYEILHKLLSVQFPGNEALLLQLSHCKAAPTEDTDNYGSIYLFPDKLQCASSEVSLRVPVDGLYIDSDGEQVNLLIHVIDGYLHELEVVKFDGSDLKDSLDPSKIEVVINK